MNDPTLLIELVRIEVISIAEDGKNPGLGGLDNVCVVVLQWNSLNMSPILNERINVSNDDTNKAETHTIQQFDGVFQID